MVSNSSSLVLFLTRGVKVTECSQVMDITSRITCKVSPLVYTPKVVLRKCLG